MRVLITGASGQLGRDLIEILGGKHELFPFDLDLDITDYKQVMGKSAEVSPEMVINCAALTNVDGCEDMTDAAFRVNAIGCQNMALAARSASAPLVTVSTDFVFDGTKKTPYDEFDTPNPISVYGRSKYAGEKLVRDIWPEHYIVRTAWLFGNNGQNFAKTMLKLSNERDELSVVDDQIGSPTFSLDLARRISELMETGWFGTYHVTNSGSTSWNGFARAILSAAGHDPEKVKPMSSAELNRPAPRPSYSVLRNMICELRGLAPLPSYEDALREFFTRPMAD